MNSPIICLLSYNDLTSCGISFQDCSFFIVAQSDDPSKISPVIEKIVHYSPRHIFLCGDHWKDAQNIYLDLIIGLENSSCTHSTYDKLDYDAVWDFLYLNRFEFVEKQKIFLPICNEKETAFEFSATFFNYLARALTDKN